MKQSDANDVNFHYSYRSVLSNEHNLLQNISTVHSDAVRFHSKMYEREMDDDNFERSTYF